MFHRLAAEPLPSGNMCASNWEILDGGEYPVKTRRIYTPFSSVRPNILTSIGINKISLLPFKFTRCDISLIS